MNRRLDQWTLLFFLVFTPHIAFGTNDGVDSAYADAYRVLVRDRAPISQFSSLLNGNLIRGDTFVVGQVSAAQYAVMFKRHDLLNVFVQNNSIARKSAIKELYWEICRNFSLQTVEVLKADKSKYNAFFVEDADFRAHCVTYGVTHLYPKLISLVDEAKELSLGEMAIIESRLETIEKRVEEVRLILVKYTE